MVQAIWHFQATTSEKILATLKWEDPEINLSHFEVIVNVGAWY